MSTLAAVDCGTNMTRLLVRRGDEDLERRMEFARLGLGVDKNQRLAPDAVQRTLDVLNDFRQVMERHDVERFRAVTTSATRDAENRDDFLGAAAEVLGQPLELITGEEEAGLAFAGATSALDPAEGPFVLADIGGGSTELAVGSGEPGEKPQAVSLDVGCVRVAERFLETDPPTAVELSQAVSVVRIYIREARNQFPEMREAARLIGVAGTFTTMAAVEMGLIGYDRSKVHHFDLTRAAAEDVFRTLATESLDDRRHNPGLEPARADVIVGGCSRCASCASWSSGPVW
ncbi:MAG: Ppx/GppA family phosphatase [Actinobacteria bacterium]|nr:Ppx/GppA family phosphatase [Actinomycetota bacterium]